MPIGNKTVDVLVVGGGPTGLILAYSLLRFGLSVHLVEKYDKSAQDMYGRSCMLFPRTLELLDQLDLFQEMAEVGYNLRQTTAYKDGKMLEGHGWSFVKKAIFGNTFFDYWLGIRQKYSEDIFRRSIKAFEKTWKLEETISTPAVLLEFTSGNEGEYPILSTASYKDETYEIRSKWIIGADGARSTVRTQAGIPFPGVSSPSRWIRMDAIVSSNMPTQRESGVAVESKTHGQVLYTPTDSGRTRIGYVLPPDLAEKYGTGEGLTVDICISEAKKALAPFTLKFEKVDWYTVYSIGQHVAEKYIDGNVILAGDACHTHSSGAAQGMNVGTHDATNLGWKLAAFTKGWITSEALDTYHIERHEWADRQSRFDQDLTELIANRIPARFNAPEGADPMHYHFIHSTENATYTVGLGIAYKANLINVETETTSVPVGARAPDVMLYKPGNRFSHRLQELTPNTGKFWICVFAGGYESPIRKDFLKQFRQYTDSDKCFVKTLAPIFQFLTIVGGEGPNPGEKMECQPWGRSYWDHSGEAHRKYGIRSESGGVIVLRPDGILATGVHLTKGEELEAYFSRFVLPVKGSAEHGEIDNVGAADETDEKYAVGEISIEGIAEKTKITKKQDYAVFSTT